MRAVRFGSYSICATLAGTPSLSCRRKSISRYARLCPPPWCRVVMRPELFRPPLPCSGRTSDFSGSSRVTSTKSAWLAPRRPGVVGLYLRIAMSARTNLAEYVDPVAFTKRDDRALDRLARAVTESGPLPFAWPIERVHVGDLDLRLVRQRVDVERVLVLIQQAVALLRNDRSEQHIAGIVEHQLCSSSDVSSAAFLAGAFLAAVFFAGAFSAVAFLAAAFFAAASSTGSAADSPASSAASASTSTAASGSALVAAPLADLPVAGPPRKDSSADCVKTTSSLISTSYVFS